MAVRFWHTLLKNANCFKIELIQIEKVIAWPDCGSSRAAALPPGCRPRNGTFLMSGHPICCSRQNRQVLREGAGSEQQKKMLSTHFANAEKTFAFCRVNENTSGPFMWNTRPAQSTLAKMSAQGKQMTTV